LRRNTAIHDVSVLFDLVHLVGRLTSDRISRAFRLAGDWSPLPCGLTGNEIAGA
jgi:hypothetical protein